MAMTLSDLGTRKHQVYMGPVEGGFKCSNCEYYPKPSRCKHPAIVKLRGAVEPGLAMVDPNGCSDYFEPK